MTAPHIFDRVAYSFRRARAQRNASESFLLEEAAQNLFGRVSAINRQFVRALDLNSRPQSFGMIKPLARDWVRTSLAASEGLSADLVVADEELLPFADRTFELVTSVLSLHAVNDLPGTLIQICRVLVPDGLFVAALFGGSTLQELRRAFAAGENETTGGVSPRVAPFADVRDLGGLLQRAGLAMPVADIERLTVRYSQFFTLAQDLRSLGETNALAERSRKALRRDTLSAVLSHYAANDSERDERLRATFDVAYLIGWAPHESRPQPPGPAGGRARLRDASKS